MKKIFLLSFLSIMFLGFSQESKNLNLDFEQTKNGEIINWVTYGTKTYKAYIDTNISQSGKNSAVIEYNGKDPAFRTWSISIPMKYKGTKIKLTGYIKTENVSEGYAGLWMRIDPYAKQFDNMSDRGVTGTTDWKKYEIELLLNPEYDKNIVFGGMLVGKGKAWFDNFSITIDGKEIEKAKLLDLTNAEKDKEFITGSKIDTIILNKTTTEKLYNLGLIWGFLKYYHPAIADAQYNWDLELFRILPEILKEENDFDKTISQWINNLGDFKIDTTKKAIKKEIKIKPDLDWINNSGFSEELKTILNKVKNAKRTDENYYVSLRKSVKNPVFSTEDRYNNMKYPDSGFRLLSLYRYWNIIQYFFPNKHLIGEDWKIVLKEFIPKFINAKNETEYKFAALEIIARIHDTHANIWSREPIIEKYWGVNYAPYQIIFVENKAVITDYYNDDYKTDGLKKGDVILKINNVLIEDFIKNNQKYICASNYPTQLRNIATKLLRTNDTILNIEILSNNSTKNINIKAYPKKNLNYKSLYHTKDTCFKIIDNNIAYLNLGSIKKEYLKEIFTDIENTNGLIIDMRCYPKEFVLYEIGRYLMPKPTTFAKYSSTSIETPGLFIIPLSTKIGKKNKKYYKNKVIILINEITQSAAEYLSMGYRVAPKATVIGSTTAGADGNISVIYLPGGIRTIISGIGILLPDGGETQRIGIVPDIVVEPTINGIKNEKDEVLEKAIELILKQ